MKGGSQQIYRRQFPDGQIRRVSVHMHPQKTFGARLLKGLLDDTGWTEDDLRRLRMIK
jgi:predicted RNA binding protein YcfA (HicA-like mRNA interferase family)